MRSPTLPASNPKRRRRWSRSRCRERWCTRYGKLSTRSWDERGRSLWTIEHVGFEDPLGRRSVQARWDRCGWDPFPERGACSAEADDHVEWVRFGWGNGTGGCKAASGCGRAVQVGRVGVDQGDWRLSYLAEVTTGKGFLKLCSFHDVMVYAIDTSAVHEP